mmetsp:Transcript_18539/g.70127  ORF Transcript_18539/g.70127 Transcript_18539/m.70127 type:complete len:1006 (-) Transcript_18539:317-3334(-)
MTDVQRAKEAIISEVSQDPVLVNIIYDRARRDAALESAAFGDLPPGAALDLVRQRVHGVVTAALSADVVLPVLNKRLHQRLRQAEQSAASGQQEDAPRKRWTSAQTHAWSDMKKTVDSRRPKATEAATEATAEAPTKSHGSSPSKSSGSSPPKSPSSSPSRWRRTWSPLRALGNMKNTWTAKSRPADRDAGEGQQENDPEAERQQAPQPLPAEQKPEVRQAGGETKPAKPRKRAWASRRTAWSDQKARREAAKEQEQAAELDKSQGLSETQGEGSVPETESPPAKVEKPKKRAWVSHKRSTWSDMKALRDAAKAAADAEAAAAATEGGNAEDGASPSAATRKAKKRSWAVGKNRTAWSDQKAKLEAARVAAAASDVAAAERLEQQAQGADDARRRSSRISELDDETRRRAATTLGSHEEALETLKRMRDEQRKPRLSDPVAEDYREILNSESESAFTDETSVEDAKSRRQQAAMEQFVKEFGQLRAMHRRRGRQRSLRSDTSDESATKETRGTTSVRLILTPTQPVQPEDDASDVLPPDSVLTGEKEADAADASATGFEDGQFQYESGYNARHNSFASESNLSVGMLYDADEELKESSEEFVIENPIRRSATTLVREESGSSTAELALRKESYSTVESTLRRDSDVITLGTRDGDLTTSEDAAYSDKERTFAGEVFEKQAFERQAAEGQIMDDQVMEDPAQEAFVARRDSECDSVAAQRGSVSIAAAQTAPSTVVEVTEEKEPSEGAPFLPSAAAAPAAAVPTAADVANAANLGISVEEYLAIMNDATTPTVTVIEQMDVAAEGGLQTTTFMGREAIEEAELLSDPIFRPSEVMDPVTAATGAGRSDVVSDPMGVGQDYSMEFEDGQEDEQDSLYACIRRQCADRYPIVEHCEEIIFSQAFRQVHPEVEEDIQALESERVDELTATLSWVRRLKPRGTASDAKLPSRAALNIASMLKPRRVRFKTDPVMSVVEIPKPFPEDIPDLFYSEVDIATFEDEAAEEGWL